MLFTKVVISLFVNAWKTLVWSELDEKGKQMPEAVLLELLTEAASAFLLGKLFSFAFCLDLGSYLSVP